MLTLQWGIKNAFYLSCGQTWVLLTVPGKEMAPGNGLYLSCIFPSLFSGNGQLIRPSDLTMGGCTAVLTTDHILQFQTELQACGSILTVCGFFSVLVFSTIWRCHNFFVSFSSDDKGGPHLLLFSEVFPIAHRGHCHFKDQPCRGGNWMPLSKVKSPQAMLFSHLIRGFSRS